MGGWLEPLAGRAWCDNDTGSLGLSGNRHLGMNIPVRHDSQLWPVRRSGAGALMQTHACLRLLCVHGLYYVQALAERSFCDVGAVGREAGRPCPLVQQLQGAGNNTVCCL